MREQTAPEYIAASGLKNPFTNTKKWQISCGLCRHIWKEKIPCSKICSALCPCCGAQNLWDAFKFAQFYSLQLEKQKMAK